MGRRNPVVLSWKKNKDGMSFRQSQRRNTPRHGRERIGALAPAGAVPEKEKGSPLEQGRKKVTCAIQPGQKGGRGFHTVLLSLRRHRKGLQRRLHKEEKRRRMSDLSILQDLRQGKREERDSFSETRNANAGGKGRVINNGQSPGRREER